MSKTAAVFSGQGSQYAGMGKELYDEFAYVREIYECGGDVLGYDLKKVCFEGEEELKDTLYAQPAIFAMGAAGFMAAQKELGFSPDCVAGHSVGEYPALCCAGAFGIEDGFKLVKTRAGAMSRASRTVGEMAMYAVIGSDDEIIRAECASAGGYVIPANFNAPGQTVISGLAEYAAKAAEALSDKGAKVVRLNASAAFHTALLKEAAAELKAVAETITFSPPKCGFYSNVTGGALTVGDFPAYFEQHSVSPVLFMKQAQAMADGGVELCVDFGPKKTAAALMKKNARHIKILGVEDLASLKKLEEFMNA